MAHGHSEQYQKKSVNNQQSDYASKGGFKDGKKKFEEQKAAKNAPNKQASSNRFSVLEGDLSD
jgi:hypothetical protein